MILFVYEKRTTTKAISIRFNVAYQSKQFQTVYAMLISEEYVGVDLEIAFTVQFSKSGLIKNQKSAVPFGNLINSMKQSQSQQQTQQQAPEEPKKDQKIG